MATSGNVAREEASEETRAGDGAHGLWRLGTTAIFDICIVNLDAGSYLRMTTEKALEKSEKDKNIDNSRITWSI